MADPTIVPNNDALPKQQLHAKIMRGWARAIDKRGKGRFADDIGCSSTGLDKQLSGSLPSLEAIDKALCVEPTVLDDWLKYRGLRVVAEDASCDVDDMQLLLGRVLVMIAEAEHPAGPGGRAVVPQEYLNGEKLMRDLHAVTGRWLEKCTSIRFGSERAA